MEISMKLKCGPKDYSDKMKWHDWFAWFPVTVANNDCRWLETVDRRGNIEYTPDGRQYWNFEYKAKGI
jgi:hypothetical protein